MSAEPIDAYDVVVIGGGAAGLNGALLLARSRRTVVVVDTGMPRNAPAEGVHGLLGHDGVPPAELLERGRDEVRRYGGHVVSGEVTDVRHDGERFTVSLAGGHVFTARRVLASCRPRAIVGARVAVKGALAATRP
jgi:thioredoxin reductase